MQAANSQHDTAKSVNILCGAKQKAAKTHVILLAQLHNVSTHTVITGW